MLSNFPADRLLRVIEGYQPTSSSASLQTISSNQSEASLAAFRQTTLRLVQLADRYQGGVLGHAASVIINLLLAYVAVEQHYQLGKFQAAQGFEISASSIHDTLDTHFSPFQVSTIGV